MKNQSHPGEMIKFELNNCKQSKAKQIQKEFIEHLGMS